MKTSEFPGKIRRVVTILAISLICSFSMVAQTTITSTTSGGLWTSATTWVGGVVPTSSNHAVINGVVYADGTVSCNNLTLNAGTTLYNQYTGNLTVTGSVVNNGSILNNPAGYPFNIAIKGNIENNGAWSLSSTTLSGTVNQVVKEASGKIFEGPIFMSDSIGDVVLGSDVLVNSNTWDLSKTTINTNGYRLLANSYTLKNGYIKSNETLILDKSVISNLNFSGNYTLDGIVYSQDVNTFNGTLTVTGTLQNYYSSTVNIKGNIVNKGSVINNPAGYPFYINVAGNVSNEGIWNVSTTNFTGTKDQNIQQTVGKSFKGVVNTTDASGDIILKSDVMFDSNIWNFNKSTLRTNGFKLMTNAYTITNGTIISNDILFLNNSVIDGIQFFGNYKLDGNVLSKNNNNEFNGTLTVLDTLFNSYSSTILIKGDVINKGSIIRHPNGYPFDLNIVGNIQNEGIWNVNTTNLVSTTDQTLQQISGKRFQGIFNTTDASGDIILKSDVMFESNTWNMNKSTVRTNGFKLMSNGYTFLNGTIISNDNLVLNNSIVDGLQFFGNYKLDGNVYSRNNSNEFNGTLTVLDTLVNNYSSTILIKGDVVNKGSIINNPNGYPFYLNIVGNVQNEGIWSVNSTNFISNTDQTIQQTPGKRFESLFNTTDSIGDIILKSDVMFETNRWGNDYKRWNINRSTIRTNGYKLMSNAYTFNNGKIVSNDILVLNNSVIDGMQFSGNYKLDGNVYSLNNSNVFNGTLTVLDTLVNSYSSTILIKGDVINKGSIINNPSGYPFHLNIVGNVQNEGLWRLSSTNFVSNTNQTLKQTKGKSFQGPINTTDSIGDLILESDVMLESNTWNLNNSTIRTNKNNLKSNAYTLVNGKIISNDTLVLNNSIIDGLKFFGDYKFDGNVYSRNNSNVFNDKFTVLDTLINNYSSTITVNGDLVNKGSIINNPTGYPFYMRIKGNLTNHHVLRLSSMYLFGTNDRTISGSNVLGIQATINVDDPIALLGDNTLPNLNFTGNPLAGCTIKKGATLTLFSLPNTTKLKNYGRISVSQEVDNTVDNTYNFYGASARTTAKAPVNRLIIDNYGYQQHPTATGTVNTWWRVRNTPQLFNDSLSWLKLTYLDDALGGIIEDSIKVFHSPNAGLSWKRIKKGYTIDKANNTVTINKAPSFGHYLLSNSALGITSFQPLVESAEPRFGGNSGQLTMYLFGAGFKKTSTVTLKLTGQSDIKADSTWLTDVLGESMLAKFNLKNRSLGVYNVIIETPGEKTLTLPAYFTIMKGERSDPWSTISGRDRFLINRWQTFNIGFGNTANSDALGTILVFVVNDLPGLEVEFPDINVVLPKGIADMGPNFTRFKDLGLYYTTQTLTGYENQKMRVYPFYIPYIAAGSAKSTRVRVKLNGSGSLKMDSWILDPLYEQIDYNLKSAEPMPTEVRACITAAAMHAWYNGALGLAEGMIPGVACWGVVDKVVDPIGYITPEELKPEGKDTWGSWFWSGVSIMGSAVQCGASFVPGVGQAVNLGIGLVNMGIDMKDGYDATQGCWNKFKKKSQNKLDSRGVTSFDPNEKVGPRGYTAERYISKEGNLNYTIFFENKKTAGAAALEVFVKDTLDSKKFDFKTFSFSSVTFGETTAKIQEYAKEFQILIDLYPKKNIIVQVHGKLDEIKGIVSWEFHSLDRISMELTEDPDLGFLPPNVTGPEGEGNVTFSCKLKETVAHGDLISNRASIVFDFNAPILTNTYKNRIDAMAPVSSVAPLPITQKDSTFTVSWNGSDLGSKISKINIFVSTNDKGYVLWKAASAPGNDVFKGKKGYKYKFVSEAVDSIGFVEPMKATAEATTTVSLGTGLNELNASNNAIQVFPNPAEHQCSIMFNFSSSSEISISLIDISGKIIRSVDKQKYNSGKQTVDINLDGIPKGLYLVKLSNDKKSYHQKLVIK